MSDSARQRRQLLANLALAVAAPLAFFGLLELVFAAAGVEPAIDREDPFVGFAGNLPLFVPEVTPDGEEWLVTANGKLELFNFQRFPRRKAPGTFRIFCLGGSTTYGRPYTDETSFVGWLREFLPALDGSRHWEVINAGGISYASYRVARLMEEIAAYEPDLIVVYTGHNEFLEERTYASMRDIPSPLRRLSAALARTRNWSVMASGLRTLGVLEDQGTDEQRDLLPEAVAARLDRSAGLDLYERDDELEVQVLRHYRASLERMAAIARSADSALLFVTPASNLRSSSPFKSQHSDGIGSQQRERSVALLDSARQHDLASRWPEELSAADQALALDPRFAAIHYQRGRALFGLERYPEAKEAFVRARDEDVCPLRALSEMRAILDEVAADTGTPLVDFIDVLEHDLARTHGHTILGEEDFLDHVHPTIDGHRRLALALAQAMQREGLLSPAATLSAEASEAVRQRVEGRIDPRRHAEALASLAWLLDWAGKREESRRLAIRALESGWETPRILLIAGKHLALDGELESALDLYRRAAKADPLSPTPHYQLGLLSIERGELDRAAAHFLLATVLWPDDPKAHEKLGLVMAERGRYDLAIASLEEARRRDPGRPRIDRLIERVRTHAGSTLRDLGAPRIAHERHPSGAIRRLAQLYQDPSGRLVLHGIYGEWGDDGSLQRVADAVDGSIAGTPVSWEDLVSDGHSGRRGD